LTEGASAGSGGDETQHPTKEITMTPTEREIQIEVVTALKTGSREGISPEALAEIENLYKTPAQELWPEGRHIFYEGDDPDGFAAEIKKEFGFDPRESNDGWCEARGFEFFCPPEHLDAIDRSGRWLLGT
jgi:hypothetical protein